MKFKTWKIFHVFVICSVSYLFSSYFSQFLTGGDFEYYTEIFSRAQLFEIKKSSYQDFVFFGEPMANFVFVLLGQIKKVEFIDVNNVLNTLIVLLFFVLARLKQFNALVFALLISNFYMVVLFFAAIKLKLALIFVLFALISPVYIRFMFWFSAFLTHFSLLLILPSILILKRPLLDKEYSLCLIFSVLFLILAASNNAISLDDTYSYVFNKIVYIIGDGISTTISIFKCFLISLVFFDLKKISFRNYFHQFLVFLPLIVSSGFLSADRIAMLVFVFGVAVYGSKAQKGNPAFYACLFYFLLKSVIFVSDVVVYGDGFWFDSFASTSSFLG